MKKHLILSAALLGLLSACTQTGGGADVKELRKDVDALKLEVFGDPLLSCEDSRVLADISAYQDSISDIPEADLEPEVWHTSNGLRKGVVTTESGLQYTVVKAGNEGATSPVGSQLITVNYHGFYPNGETFDSSYDRQEPIEFPANGVIKGWIEAMGTMKPCEARTLYIPGNLAYGETGRGAIPPNATLLFHVQLLGINQ